MITTECKPVALAQHDRRLGEPLAVDEGAIGTAQILDAEILALQEYMRMTPRDVIDLMRVKVLVAREQFICLADEKREALYLDLLKSQIATLGQ